MRLLPLYSLAALAAVVVAQALAWSPESAASPGPDTAPTTDARTRSVVLPWGRGPAQAGLRPGGPERHAEGPSAVAVGAKGEVFVLDRLNERVLRVEGEPAVAAAVPADAEDLAVAADGALAVRSLLRSRAWLFDAGQPAGEVAIPRTLRDVVGFSVGASRAVTVSTAHQETLRLGSPAAPQTEPSVLRSRREGAVILPDGRGLSVRLDADRNPELLWYRQGDGRDHVVSTRRLSGPALSARLIGASAGAACLALEHREPGAGFVVRRELVCVDSGTGSERLRLALRGNPVYVPLRHAAVGGDPPRLAWIEPGRDGLRVTVTTVPSTGSEVQR